MADYNANIRVNADTRAAERSLKQLEQKLSQLGQGIDLGKSIGRGVTEALLPAKALKQIDRELATIASRADTTAKKVARIFEGAGTLGVAAKGIQDVSHYLQDLSVRAGDAVDSLSQIPTAVRAVVPGLKPASDAANLLAKSISTLEYKFSSLQGGAESVVHMLGNISPVAATAGASLAVVAGAIEDQLLRAMRQLDSEGTAALQNITEQTQQLIKQLASFGLPQGGTLAQFERLLGKGQERLRNSPAGSPESLRAVNTILRAQELITEELRKQDTLLRTADGLRPTSVENRATNTYNTTQNRKSFIAQQTADLQKLNAAIAEMNLGGSNPFGIGPDQQQEALLTRYTSDMEHLQQVLEKMEGRTANPFGMTAQQIEIADHNTNKWKADLEQVNAELIDLMQLHRSLGQMEGRTSNPFGIEQQQIEDAYNFRISEEKAFSNLRLDTIQRQLNAELDSVDEVFKYRTAANAAALRDFDRRLADRGQAQTNAKNADKARNQKLESIALGVGFPLLFGGGAGTVGGSLVGSFIGSGFGGQILGGAIGQALDQFAAAAADMGSALRDPITNFQKIADAGLLASKSQEYYIQKLTEVGRVSEATAIVQGEIIKKIGVGGYNDLTAAGAASDRLAKAWAELNLQLQAAVAGPLADLLNWVTALVGAANAGGRRDAGTRDFLTELAKDPKKYASYIRESQAMARNNGGTIDPNAIARLRQQYLPNGIPAPTSQLGPETAANALKAAQEQADTIKSAYREGFQLQQQAHDLQRQGLDLQRRIADDIFNKQQQVFRTQIETERQRRQIAIETVDLEYRRRISNEEGRVAQVLEAEAALMRTKAQGEADLEARRRNTELDIAKQQRDTQNYVYQLNRDIDAIRRATLSFEMDAADYRLKIERQVQDQRRLDTAVSGITPADIGGTGFTNQQLSNATQAASRFTGVANMCSESVKAFYKSLGVSLPGVTAWADTVRKAGTVMKDWSKLKPGDIVATGRPGDTPHVGVYTGGNNVFHQSASRGLKAGNYPDLSYFKQGGYFVRPNSTSAQLTTAASAVQRPSIPGVAGSNVAGQSTALDQRDAALKREQLTLQQQLNKLGEDAATQRVLEAARGPKDLQQRREAVALAKAELAAIIPGSRVLQEQLALEAQGLVKLQQRKDQDAQILQTTKLTGAARKELEAALAQGLLITQQQIDLDREALRLTQEKQYAVERASLQSQLGVIGTGASAGFTGGAATAYENALLQYGDPTKANEIAMVTQQIDMARMATDGWHTSIQAVGGAFGEAMTTGVASLVNGTQTAQQVFAQFLQGIGQALSSAAQQMIATYIAIGIAKLFAGLGGGGGGGNPSGMFGPGAPTEAFAGGGIFTGAGPFQFRAAGGPVTGSSPYVVGERGPELFVPGTGGSVVPTNDLRAAMGPGTAGSTPILNMSFESTNIGGVEYVSRDQLEAAMAATRRAASRDGAKRGMSMTLDKLQQSPSTRNRVGLR